MLIFAFCICLFFSCYFSSLTSSFTLLWFSSFLSLTVLKKKLYPSLVLACLSGMIGDIICDDPFGVHAIAHTSVVFLLYRYKIFFSSEKPLHIGIYTYFVSLTLTFLQAFLLFLFDRRIPFTGECFLGDLLIMPLLDAGFAFLMIALPLKFAQELSSWIRTIKLKYFLTSR